MNWQTQCFILYEMFREWMKETFGSGVDFYAMPSSFDERYVK